MNSRRLRWLVLGFVCLWFGMLVPVHQRGLMKLPGPKLAAAATASQSSHCHPRVAPEPVAEPPCHPRHQATQALTTTAGQPSAPERHGEGSTGADDCAVCHYVLGLHLPPPVTFDVAPLGLLRERLPEEPAAAPLRHAAMPFHGLDPPTA